MREDGELPEEFFGPVAYADRWLWLALAAVLAVVVYYVAVLVLTRARRTDAARRALADVPSARRVHLERLDQIEAEVAEERLTARDGHQQLSETVRSYVGSVSSLPAPTMALADFRAQAPAALIDAIELMYPPEFAPDDIGEARERFDEALRQARRLVASWS